ncbi:MAG: heavy metal-binding domain-containing protein [Chloroflexota bacterium]
MAAEQEQGIPPHALERLRGMRGEGGRKQLFTSDLTVSEFLLVKEAGFEPLGLVVGTSIYHIGLQVARLRQNMEMDILTQAMYHARELAMRRMEEEAHVLGADGVVGVRLVVGRYSWGANLAEFKAIGTAVKSRDGQGRRQPNGKPFTSDLSGQDFWTLLRAGYMPIALVFGTCVYHVAHQSFGQWFQQMGRNVEMPNFTQALYDAREMAMERMQHEADAVGAEGIVGANIHESTHSWSSHVIEFLSVGTAITGTSADHIIASPQITMSLNADHHPPSVVHAAAVPPSGG